MTRGNGYLAWGLAFGLVGLLGVGLGLQWRAQPPPLAFWCDGENAHRVQTDTQSAWLLTRFSLNVQPDERGYLRFSARLVDADSGAGLGFMHRYSAFRAERQQTSMLIEVQQTTRSETETLTAGQLESLGIFMFQPGAKMSFWIRPLDGRRYLIEDGSDFFSLCTRRQPGALNET